MRVRGFTQDDAHIFCRPDQLEDEILRVLDFVDEHPPHLRLRPLRHLPLDEAARRRAAATSSGTVATAALRKALETRGLPYEVDPGEGVFYGPKIDIKIKDALDRAWQCSTIQVDFHNPKRFELEYIGEDGKAHQPVMVHRALLGSLERFFGVLIEHYAGAFPLWLAPVQAVVIPVAEKHQDYAPRGGRGAAHARACACTWTTATRSWATRSARPRCRRSPTCSWWGTRKSRRRACPCATARRATSGRRTWRRSAHASSASSAERATRGRGAGTERRRCLIDSKTVRINDRIRAKEVRVIDEDGVAARDHAARPGAHAGRGEGPRPRGDRGHRHPAGLPDHELRQVLLPAGQARGRGAQAPAAHPDQGSEVPARRSTSTTSRSSGGTSSASSWTATR